MMFYMNSKEFQDIFLQNEKDNDILKAQYVITSSRIMKRPSDRNPFDDQMVIAKSFLFPNPETCMSPDDETFREAYMHQLEFSKYFIATLIDGSIRKKYNIIFLCSKKEDKMKYHKILSEFIYLKFGYPIYNYKLYACGASKLIKYDKNKVLNICSEILKEAKEREYINNLKSGKDGIQRIMNGYKKKKKSSLRKELKKRGLYVSGMDKKEMLETIEEFLI